MMVFAQLLLENGNILCTFSFTCMPRREELISIAVVGRFRVLDVQHAAGDPADNNPPAWSRLIVRLGS